MAAWVAPLISAGAGLIGKLFGGNDDNKSSNRVDYKQMVKDAEAAGFNPLTVLRAGGAAGYTTTHHPALSSVNTVGAIAEAVGNFAMNYDANKAVREQAEFDLVQAQIANIQTETAQRKAAMLAVPKRIAGNAKDSAGRPAEDYSKTPKLSLPWATPLAVGPKPEAGEPTVTNPYPLSGGLLVNPRFKDAEAGETRYGDIAQEFFGAMNLAADTVYTFAHDWNTRTKVRKLSDKEKAAQRKTWHGGWLPSIEYRQ